jgi:hypothetical protein
MPVVLPPLVAYLRVYEPLAAFPRLRRARLQRAIELGSLDPVHTGHRERELWLRSQLATPRRLLPGEWSDGSAIPEGPADVLVLRMSGKPAGAPLVCPLEVRSRSAAALLGLLATDPPATRATALTEEPSAAGQRARAAIAALGSGAVHTVSSTWTVPLPWFAVVDPASRQVCAAPRPDPARRVCWHASLPAATSRAERAYEITRSSLGEDGPARVLRDIGRWLRHFDAGSVVELDYGGLVQLMDDELLHTDNSAADVHAAVDALETGDTEAVALAYERLHEYWSELAAFEWNG